MKVVQTVAITGATGFIGINLLHVFVRAGMRIRALYRPNSSNIRPDLPGIEWIEGTLEDSLALRGLLSGADALVHCAGLVKANREEDFFQVNTQGTRSVLDALHKASFKGPFVFISSLAARHPGLSPYAKSKREAEKMVKGDCPVPWTIVRPPAVYGPGDREILPLFKAMEKGVAIIPAPKTNRFSLIHVLDLSEAILEACQSEAVAGRILELHDGTPGGYDWMEVVETFCLVKGKRVVPIHVPAGFLRFSALLSLALSRVSGRPAMLTPWKVRELLHSDWVCANHVENHGLSWNPRITLKIALENGLIG